MDGRVLPMQDQIQLLNQMEQDLESIDKQLDPFQKKLLDVAQNHQKFLDTLKGGSFWPASWKEATALLKDSAIAGGIASVGSIPLNLIVMFNSWYLMPAAAIANQVATSTAGAMIPMEISKIQRFTKAAFLLKTQSGEKEKLAKEATEEEIYQEFVKLRVKLAMTLGKTSSFATTSMGIGSFLGFITGFLYFAC
uniref:Uncharacterized protein n=1 Tax=Ditylenchus dipsaci TaxID=166011 RepID=A0A915DLP9_9BILA